jgi:hypothetical protein
MAGGAFSLHSLSFGSDGYESRFEGNYASAASFFASQSLARALQISENYYRPLHTTSPMPLLAFTVQENLNRRFTLSEFATRSNGQWNLNYGGGLRWDRFDVNVSYATTFIPLAANGGRFEQAMNASGHVNLGRWQFGVRSYVQPDGTMYYAYEVKSFYFHPTGNGNIHAPSSSSPMGLPRYLIVGTVTLEGTGKPVADVPIRIGDQLVYTDETGAFSQYVTRKHTYKIQLLLDRQIDAHYYEQVSGPTEVMSGTDATLVQAQFVVRVNQKKIPSLPKGGIIIGNPDAATNAPTGSGQGGGSLKDAGGPSVNDPQ